MGLLDKLKFKGALIGAKLAGKEVSGVASIRALLNKYGKTISGIVVGLCSWAYAQGCQPVLGFDPAASLHITCDTIQHMLLVLSAFLVGAGISEPDQFIRDFKAKGATRRADDPKP